MLGACVPLALRAPLALAATIAGVFAIFHGHAHGAELPASAHPVAYAIGFALAARLVHLSGFALGLAVKWSNGEVAVRVAGALIDASGFGFLLV